MMKNLATLRHNESNLITISIYQQLAYALYIF